MSKNCKCKTNKVLLEKVVSRATELYQLKKLAKGVTEEMLPIDLPSDQIHALAQALVEEINKVL